MAERIEFRGQDVRKNENVCPFVLSACKAAFPQSNTSEINVKSDSIEARAFENASSKELYRELWQASIHLLQLAPKPSKPLPTADSSSLTQQIGRYTATSHRSGLFSTVFRASDPTGYSSSPLAIKLTTPSRMSPPHNSLREARLLRLAAHENVVPLYSTFSQPGGQFILEFPFMPFTLEELLDHNHISSFSQLSSLLRGLFSGIAHVHSVDIIHRDIKPSNILLRTPQSSAYLADFGIAWKEGDPDCETADKKITDVGTTAYRPPELLFGNASYESSLDMWAAGCVVAECLLALTGVRRTLFDAGELGSELALIQSIFKTMGTPNEFTWPEAVEFPDWGKMQFHEYPAKPWEKILPVVEAEAVDLVRHLVRYESGERLKAVEVLEHGYLKLKTTGPDLQHKTM